MTDQELRKLSRKDLLELLVVQGRERDTLQMELETAKAALQEHKICMEQTGSIAEAALRLNGVFEAAEAAAQQYLENVRIRCEQMEEECGRREAVCAAKEEESKQKIERQLAQAAQELKKIEEDTREKCERMEREAKQSAESYWSEVSVRLEAFYQEHEDLRKMLSDPGRRI